MALLRRFWDSATGTCSYLIGSAASHQAVFIDPVREQAPLYLGVLQELGLSLAAVLETHLHADHVTAAATLRRLTGASMIAGAQSGLQCADRLLADGESLIVGDLAFQALATPGHSPGCVTYAWGDRLFTGDALHIGGCGRTDEPGANAGQLFDSITRRLLPHPDEHLVYPGHGTQQRWVSCIGEERRTNPLLLGVSRDEFIALTKRRQEPPLPSPSETQAANRHCGEMPEGRPDSDFSH